MLGAAADQVLAEIVGDSSTTVRGISLSSQRVHPGDVYAALPGARAHGLDFAEQALSAGAVALLVGSADRDRLGASGVSLPALVVDDPRAVLGALSAAIYGRPADDLVMVAITGTQGKTTTSRLADSGLLASGVLSSVIGTIGTRIAGADVKTVLTTPEAPDLHGLLASMRQHHVAACVMEVSSHALVKGRVDGVVFDVAVFTNLGRDHLDFHADVEDYFAAKADLFTPARARRALINLGDPYGRRLAEQVNAHSGIPVRTFAIDPAYTAIADWRAIDIEATAAGSTFVVEGPDGRRIETSCPLPGDFNVANALAAIAACAEAGFDPAAVAAGIASSHGVPGRLERIETTAGSADFEVIVDYAHKPDALEATLATLRPVTSGRLVVVIGAGGDRDPGKRPLMGEIAARLADVVVITDDNPRSEDPAEIRAELLAGAGAAADAGTAHAEVIERADRRDAIRTAVGLAGTGDVILIAGKGHETGQEIAGAVHPFDDRAVAREELAGR